MKYNLPDWVLRKLYFFAQKYSIEKLVLFGSRARGTHTETRDIYIAVYGGDYADTVQLYFGFYCS